MPDINQMDEALARIERSMDDTHGKLAKSVEEQKQQIRDIGGTATTTSVELKKLGERYDQELADYKGELEGYKSELSNLAESNTELKRLFAEQEKAAADREWRESGGKKDIGDVLEKDADYKEFLDRLEKSPRGYRLELKESLRDNYSFNGSEKKAITDGLPELRNVLARNEWTRIFGVYQTDAKRIRDYMTVIPADGAAYAYAERTMFENNAAFQSAEGALKATSNWDFTERLAGSYTLAHSTTVSRQQMRQLPTVIDFMKNELQEGLYDAETRAVLFSDGTGNSFKGITQHERIQLFNETVDSTDTAIDILRKSEDPLEDIRIQGDLYVMNHRDWTKIELLKDEEGRYLWVQVQIGGSARMWRKPVLATPFMTAGMFINGAFKTCAFLLDFARSSIAMYPQHDDLALRNMVLILNEEDIGLAVHTPQGFVVGNLDGSPMGSGS